jgi:hypothetical protein
LDDCTVIVTIRNKQVIDLLGLCGSSFGCFV